MPRIIISVAIALALPIIVNLWYMPLGHAIAAGAENDSDQARTLSPEMTDALLACNKGNSEACKRLASWLSSHEAQGSYQLPTEAAGLFDKCENTIERDACSTVGDLLLLGKNGWPEDKEFAWAVYERGCAKGQSHSCVLLGRLSENFDRHDAAVEYYKKACDSGEGEGCTAIGLNDLEGTPDEKDVSKALIQLQKGCDLGDGEGCTILGAFYMGGKRIPKDENNGLKLFQKGCNMGEAKGCYFLAGAYLTGKAGLIKNSSKALGLLRLSCDLGLDEACTKLGQANDGSEIR